MLSTTTGQGLLKYNLLDAHDYSLPAFLTMASTASSRHHGISKLIAGVTATIFAASLERVVWFSALLLLARSMQVVFH
jgi:hypothetical protein